jgi:hypothetical protein
VDRLFCSLRDAMVGSLSMDTIAMSSAKVVVVSGEDGRSAVCGKYSNGPRTLLCGTPAFAEKNSVCSFLILMKKFLLVR